MATLSEEARVALWAEFMAENVSEISILKSDLRAAVDATDNWIDINAISYNLALPAAARSGLTAKQKALLFMYVASRRFGVL